MSAKAYAPPQLAAPIDIDLSRNEGRMPRGLDLPELLQGLPRYPDTDPLRAELAQLYDVESARVLVTAGGDDALLRTCLAALGSGGKALVTTPTFEMIPRYVAMAGSALEEVPWPEGPFPTERFLDAVDKSTRVAFVVSPNNPTGGVATPEDLVRIARRMKGRLVVLDAAYGELALDDPTQCSLQLPNVVVVRTLSKAWGLAGLRVGCALGSRSWIRKLAACGNPYPVSAASSEIALARLGSGAEDMRDYVDRVRTEREQLTTQLKILGAQPATPSEANFVLARGVDPEWVTQAAAALGVALRAFPDRSELRDAVRITLPGDPATYDYLIGVLRAVMAPEALLFDLDGVLADVSGSYRSAIVQTAASYGVRLKATDIESAKDQGNANDDWALTHDLLTERGVEATLRQVTSKFEELYQGSTGVDGLREQESALVSREQLARWARRFRLAVVTGRPRADAERFLDRFGLRDCFQAVVCREDAPLKPDPAPVRLAMERLGVRSAWMLGDTRDDLVAARAAGVVPIAVLAPGSHPQRARPRLLRAGAATVLERTVDLQELLP